MSTILPTNQTPETRGCTKRPAPLSPATKALLYCTPFAGVWAVIEDPAHWWILAAAVIGAPIAVAIVRMVQSLRIGGARR